MRKQLGDRLPEFTPEEAELVKGSNDFYGMNHYCANYIKHKDTEPELDDHAGNLEILMQNKKGEWIGPETQSVWLRPMPLGFRKLIKWLSDRYGGPTFYVTENGTSLKGENELPLEELLNDDFRVEYFRGYIGALADAHTLDGVDVRGYSAWSLMEYVIPTVLISLLNLSRNRTSELWKDICHFWSWVSLVSVMSIKFPPVFRGPSCANGVPAATSSGLKATRHVSV
jgi:beta-glucosidase/6-phospho-beta-glucosidase/beta-galactosidase